MVTKKILGVSLLLLLANSAFADVYTAKDGGCVKAGYDRQVLQKAGPWKGSYRCFCGIKGVSTRQISTNPRQIELDKKYSNPEIAAKFNLKYEKSGASTMSETGSTK